MNQSVGENEGMTKEQEREFALDTRRMFQLALLNEGKDKGVIIEDYRFIVENEHPFEVHVKRAGNDKVLFVSNPYERNVSYKDEMRIEDIRKLTTIVQDVEKGCYLHKLALDEDVLVVKE